MALNLEMYIVYQYHIFCIYSDTSFKIKRHFIENKISKDS